MQYTTLGRTGVTVSRLCLGCMSYGSTQWRPWVLEEQAAMPFFRKAVEAGINFFDTADVYSLGASEEITGKALREYAKPEQVVLATKVFNRVGEGPNMKGLSRKHIQQGCEASLRRLGVETIDLYQVHRFDPRAPLDEMLAALDLLVHQGKVRYIGTSCARLAVRAVAFAFGTERLGTVRQHAKPLQSHLPGRRAGDDPALPGGRDCGDPVVAAGPRPFGGHAQGADDKTSTSRAASDEFAWKLYDHPGDVDVMHACQDVAAKRGVQPAKVAIAWLLSQPAVTAPIVGATKIEHLEASLAAVDLTLSDEEIRQLEKPYQPHAVRGFE